MFVPVPLRRAACLAAVSTALLISACGGGGGGSPAAATTGSAATAVTTSLLPSSASVANQCTPDVEKQWVRSYVDEAYLWYDQVPQVDASASTTPELYFSALLVRTPDASGQATDRFSTVMTATAADTMQGLSTASLSPSIAASGTSPVPLSKTLTSTGGRKVGYIVFNQHSKGAQDALITAFRGMQSAGVQDLVLDLRYNAGGFLYIAQAAAAMVAGPDAAGQVFERARYSAKRAADTAGGAFYFPSQVEVAETQYPQGTPLPQLNLPRLYVLTSPYTCSASESIINSLRGIGVQVVLLGDRTCGKPYGFHRKDNCGKAYFPIEFQLTNSAGQGDYTSGFPVQCPVQENPTTPLGSTSEPLLAGALHHIDTGSCPVVASTAVQVRGASRASLFDRPGAPDASSPMYQPGWNGRALLQ
ncbi:S41 family peptidase [Ramlibacter sp. MMS24-I3-19]|uniref:S41 family peptidase n=1 Tax=Ramlibacter sp. MMS24-I3-19 TaxID=3416606 RepID=UPI003D01F45F